MDLISRRAPLVFDVTGCRVGVSVFVFGVVGFTSGFVCAFIGHVFVRYVANHRQVYLVDHEWTQLLVLYMTELEIGLSAVTTFSHSLQREEISPCGIYCMTEV